MSWAIFWKNPLQKRQTTGQTLLESKKILVFSLYHLAVVMTKKCKLEPFELQGILKKVIKIQKCVNITLWAAEKVNKDMKVYYIQNNFR